MCYYLSLGSNLGERELNISQALKQIEQQIGHISRCSSFYYSAPWGFESEHEFCNICCSVETELAPFDMLNATQSIEQQLGRTHKSVHQQYQDRTIDIDIIKAYDEEGKEMCLDTPTLTIPHPLWQQRDFVCVPLKEISEPEN